MDRYALAEPLTTALRDQLQQHPELLQELLSNRGLTAPEDIELFLNPSYDKHLHDPFLMNDMDVAVERTLKAITNNESIVIYSDFDADGIPGGAMMARFFKMIGFENFKNYIPHRHEEGYGFHMEAVETFAEQKTDLIITIDCGITSIDEVVRANEFGMDVIVTDHHECKDELPPAVAVLNHKRLDSTYPEQVLCGSGVAFKFVQGLILRGEFDLAPGAEKALLDLVGIATLSDMVPLTGENRALARFGLMVLRISRRPGLVKLLRKLNINQQHLNEDDVGFMVTPRINAASRMDHPDYAFNLLATDDEKEAGAVVDHLQKLNNERKGVVASITREVHKQLPDNVDELKVICVGKPAWRPSLLGLAANKLVEEYGKPVFLWGKEGGGVLKGSCRCPEAMSVVKILEASGDAVEQFGGHNAAAGFAVSPEKIHDLPERLEEAFAVLEKQGFEITEKPMVDREMSFDEVSWKTFEDIDRLAPFGMGNPKPLFHFKNAEVMSVRAFGKTGDHLELSFQNSKGGKVNAIGFFMKADQFACDLKEGEKISLLANLEKSMFRGRKELRLRIVDVV